MTAATRGLLQATALCESYAVSDLRAVARLLGHHRHLAAILAEVPGVLGQFFPGAPLRLHVDGDGLVVAVAVRDVEAVLTNPLSPLLAFDRCWWYAVFPHCGGHLTIDVETL